MRIRTQILLGYSYLVALLLAGALGAAVSFYQLGHELDGILSSAGPSARTGLENTFHAGVRDLLRRYTEPGFQGIDESQGFGPFQLALKTARETGTDPESRVVLEKIEVDFRRLQKIISQLPVEEANPQTRALEVFPLVESIEKDLTELSRRKEELILQVDTRLRRKTRIRTMAFSLLVILALLSLVLLSRELRRSLLSRLDELRELAHEIRRGHSHRRAFVASRDELGLLAEAINRLLDAWDEERQESKGQELRRRRIILALLAAFEKPAIVVLPDGRILASTVNQDEEEIAALAAKPEAAGRSGWKRIELQTPQHASAGFLLLRTDEASERESGE